MKPNPTPQSSLTFSLPGAYLGITLPTVPTGGEGYWQKGGLTFHSNPATAKPLAAPVPARPTKWPLPMLLAKREAPTCVTRGMNEPGCFSGPPPTSQPSLSHRPPHHASSCQEVAAHGASVGSAHGLGDRSWRDLGSGHISGPH